HRATQGYPFLVEETTRWLLSRNALTLQEGACRVSAPSGKLDLQVELDRGIVARAAAQGKAALHCLQLLAVCARPIEVGHLQQAMARDLGTMLATLEAAQLVIPVAGPRPRHALAHDRIRESLFAALSDEERVPLHAQLGAAFADFFRQTGAAELAVL